MGIGNNETLEKFFKLHLVYTIASETVLLENADIACGKTY